MKKYEPQRNNPPVSLSDGQGGRLLVREQGARALALWANEQEDSAFWHADGAAHPDLPWNVGGDRTWISPELDYYTDASGQYDVPAQLDPGNWKLDLSSNSLVAASMDCELLHRTSGRNVLLQLTKQFTLTPNPYAMNSGSAAGMSESVSYIGYEVHTRMHLSPGDSRPAAECESAPGFCNLWSIMQVPPRGRILVPSYGPVRPRTMFSQTDTVNVELAPHGFRIPCEGVHSFKLSVDALSSTGRFGYLRRLDDNRSSLVVRQFTVHPSGIYPDYPPDDSHYKGSCMQFYYDGGQLGHFAELEYHSPALSIDVPGASSDVSKVYYFVGPHDNIEQISQDLLGMRSVL
ncbi:hypothetical protein M6D81_21160 [Paenibacillus sp. J5C_2022]|uniref:DUF6786 family protein n=1 Tax=Paenibacillus sp. J5C2022 TaxID=2977129 RepID=UPI0021CE6910|nr:DUF6786 family protein [Paenibacillus sp. J5C2022]MCU6711207.1 hypothetical protein [Paenibacillus sp. J5C2022]